MTREEAIKELQESHDMMRSYDVDESESRLMTALNMAIQALSQEPCDDVISREAVQKEINCWIGSGEYRYAMSERFLIDRINALPPVTQKYGKWIEHPEIETSAPEYLMFYECSECGDKQCFCKSDIHKKRFCNNCGARMESEEIIEKVKQERIIGHCKDCKYFEYDSVAKVDGILLIVAHEICNKWGNGCKTKEDGYCYLYEPQERR